MRRLCVTDCFQVSVREQQEEVCLSQTFSSHQACVISAGKSKRGTEPVFPQCSNVMRLNGRTLALLNI